MNTPDLEKTAFIDLAEPEPPLPVAVVNSELHSLLLLANVLSVGWSYFCLHSSTNRRSFAYEFMHEEAAWYMLWYSCQTFAFLVSITNVSVGLCLLYGMKDLFVERVRSTRRRWRQGVLLLLGLVVVCAAVPAGFLPFRFTMVDTDLHDENLWIVWDI